MMPMTTVFSARGALGHAMHGVAAAALLCVAGVAVAQANPPEAPRLTPTPTTPLAGSMTSTLPGYTGTPGNTATLVDPSGTTVPKITPAPEPRG